MATLVLTALGTALGGPFGGALGSLVGSQIDRAVLGGGARRDGPRIRELAVTTSSYGTAIPRHFGTMRAPGSVIWANDLVESRETSGGKGRPSTTSYSYAASFAVALASRPIRGLGRVWADGSLLRGAAEDLKTGGALRVYSGHGDQPPDPLIASAQGADECPAFRGLAYCVFDSLHLADFGNRIPALTFEILADDGEVTLATLVEPIGATGPEGPSLPGLRGFSDEGGSLLALLETVGEAYPLACDTGGEGLVIEPSEAIPAEPAMLPEAAVDFDEDAFGGAAGQTARRRPDARDIPDGLRYYDTARDYQLGLQRADGRARAGRGRVLDFPGALDAATARSLVNAAAERAGWSRETLAWRVAELDPALAPGQVVRVPGQAGHWRVENWEWRERGVELELRRLPRGPARQSPTDAGQALPAPDLVATPTVLVAFEAPWDGLGDGTSRRVFAAASSASAGWTGAALFADQSGELVPLGGSGARRSVVGQTIAALPPSPALRLERLASIDVELVSTDFVLSGASADDLANGANRALVGGEVVQFAEASPIVGAQWRLRGLLRGRGGTEPGARAGQPAGAPFVLLDDRPVALDPARVGTAANLAAIGLVDSEPVTAPVLNPGMSLRPLVPVHPRSRASGSGGLVLEWTRRARGAWNWPDAVETPLNEQAEAYLVGVGNTANPDLAWQLVEPRFELSAAQLVQLEAEHSGKPLWVRQVGSFAASDPLLMMTIA
jgi:hypothetical protein